MKTKNLKYMMCRWMAVLVVLTAVCLSACDEITDETYTDVEMVIPSETGKFSYNTHVLKEYTLLIVDEVEFHENLEPLGIQVDEVRFYIDGHMVTSFTQAPYDFEYKMKNLPAGEHTIRMEYDLSGEGFLPGTGVTEKELKLNNVSVAFFYPEILTFDDKSFVDADTINITRYSGYKNMKVSNMRYYINETLVGSDAEEPFVFRGFIDRLEYGVYDFKVEYDVTTPGGITATHEIQKPVEADTLYQSFASIDALNFDGKTYLDADTLHVPYKLSTLHLKIDAVHYYLNGKLLATDTEEPFSYRGYTELLEDRQHTLKIVAEIVSETGEKATSSQTKTFTPSKQSSYLNVDALNFDEKTCLQINDVSLPYQLKSLDMTVKEMRFYVDDKLLATDTEAPYNFYGFTDLLDKTEHTLKAVYEVESPQGETATCTIVCPFTPDGNISYVSTTAIDFNEKTYLKVNNVSLPYELNTLRLTVNEMRFYVDDRQVSKFTGEPYSYDLFIDKCTNENCTFKLVYDVTAPDGSTASYTYTEPLAIKTNSLYLTTEKPSADNDTFKVTNISGNWEIYECLLETVEVQYHIDGQLMKTLTAAPYTWEWVDTGLAPGTHTLKTVYKVKDAQGTTATTQEENSFYIWSY
mgnify:CR=1 FL=1